MSKYNNILKQGVEENIITEEQCSRLITLSMKEEIKQKDVQSHISSFDASVFFWSIGSSLLLVSMVLIIGWSWSEYQTSGLLASSLFAIVIISSLARYFKRVSKPHIPGLLFSIESLLWGCFVAALASKVGVNEESILTLSMIAIAIPSSFYLCKTNYSFLILPVYIPLLTIFAYWTGIDINLSDRGSWFGIGWATVLIGWWLKLRSLINYNFWLNKLALIQLLWGSTVFVHVSPFDIELPFLIYSCGLLVLAMFLSAISFVFAGLLGIVIYLNSLIDYGGSDIPLISFFIGSQAFMLIIAANHVHKHRGRISYFISSHAPEMLIKSGPPNK